MIGTNKQLIALASICLIITAVFLFELGLFISRENYLKEIAVLKSNHENYLGQSSLTIDKLGAELESKEQQLNELSQNKEELNSQVDQLSQQIAGLSTSSSVYPFAIPSTGTVGSQVSTYLDENNGYYHYGVDFWTITSNGGAINTHRGNPVFSACDGVVESFQTGNGGVTIRCDLIPSFYNVPAHKVFTYYGHMANAVTKEQFIYVKIGQRVRKGQFIGYQGDLSMFTPDMRNVHLHFSVFSGFKEADGTQDPCKYIGGNCQKVGEFFVNESR
jgi:murein DD-endopeptidase MepM/ murein hydrolase activator NlpD